MKISNVQVYGLENAIRVSKFPKTVDETKPTTKSTDMTKALFSARTGTGHDSALNGVIVQFDLKFTIKAWTEAERYHFLDFISSQSTMHCIQRFDIKSRCNEYVDDRIIDVLNELKDNYANDASKENFLKLVYNVPVGFELTAGMTTNYRQLKTIYQQRKNHRLPEWQDFCKWIETLPRFKELVLGESDADC